MRTNQPWNQRLTVLETIKRTLVRPSMTNLGMTVRADCAVSACSPLPLSIKVLAHWLSVGWSQLWTDGDALTSICCLVAKRVTLCDPMDCSLSDSSVHGIFQARILGWVAISCSRGSSGSRDWTFISCFSCTDRWIPYHWATWKSALTVSYAAARNCPYSRVDRCFSFLLLKTTSRLSFLLWFCLFHGAVLVCGFSM